MVLLVYDHLIMQSIENFFKFKKTKLTTKKAIIFSTRLKSFSHSQLANCYEKFSYLIPCNFKDCWTPFLSDSRRYGSKPGKFGSDRRLQTLAFNFGIAHAIKEDKYIPYRKLGSRMVSDDHMCVFIIMIKIGKPENDNFGLGLSGNYLNLVNKD